MCIYKHSAGYRNKILFHNHHHRGSVNAIKSEIVSPNAASTKISPDTSVSPYMALVHDAIACTAVMFASED